MSTNRIVGTTAPIAAGAAMFLVGSQAAVLSQLVSYPVFGGQAMRYGLAGILLLTLAQLRRVSQVRLTSRDVFLICGLAATGLAGFNLFQVAAVREASPATVGTVLAALPVVLAIVGPLTAGRWPSRRVVLAACVVAVGAALPTGLGTTSALGLVLALGVLACEVGFSLFALPLTRRHGAIRTSAYASVAATPMLLVAGAVFDGTGLVRLPTVAEAVGLAYLSVIVTVVAFVLWYYALPRMGADRAGLFAGVVPVGAMLTGIVIGVGWPTATDLLGAALVGAGVAIGVRNHEPGRQLTTRRRNRPDTARSDSATRARERTRPGRPARRPRSRAPAGPTG